MPTATDLVGLGMPPQLANVLGNEPSAVTCAGTAQATATIAKSKNVELTAASSQDGAIVAADSLIGSAHYFFNSSATTAKVYCPVGATMNGSSNGSVSIAQNKGAFVWQYKKGAWASVLTA